MVLTEAEILVIGNQADPHVRAVRNAFSKRALRSLIVLDGESLGQTPYLYRNGGLELFEPDRTVLLATARAGWIRRVFPADWGEGVPIGSLDAAKLSAWSSLLKSVLIRPGVSWLSGPRALAAGEDKLTQERAARSLGFNYPETVVSSSPEFIPDHLDELVVKPLGSGQFTARGNVHAVFAQGIDRGDPRLESLSEAPFLIQRRLDVETHFRVVTVGSTAWVACIDGLGLPIDWRSVGAAHSGFTQYEGLLAPHLKDSAIAVAAKLELGYSSQDWVLGSDELWLLDVNPSGQWLFLPDPIATEISVAIARTLESLGMNNA